MPHVEQLIGWSSAALLVATIGTQIFRQWQAGTSAGVSRFLFVGQLTASSGLAIYSWLGRDWVFLTLNILMATAAIAGLGLCLLHARRGDDVPACEPAE